MAFAYIGPRALAVRLLGTADSLDSHNVILSTSGSRGHRRTSSYHTNKMIVGGGVF
jgi:hypothetical protein